MKSIDKAILLFSVIAFLSYYTFLRDNKHSNGYNSDTPIPKDTLINLLNLPEGKLIKRKMVFDLAYDLAKSNQVVCKYVGIDGHISYEYKKYEKLKQLASDSDLVILTSSKSPVIKAYAFEILCSRNYKNIVEVFETNINDTNSFSSYCGCIGITEHINAYFLRCISNFITASAYEKYKKLILKLYPGENPFTLG